MSADKQDEADHLAAEQRREKARELQTEFERIHARWRQEAAIDAEFEPVARQVMSAWSEAVFGPDEHGYLLAEARALLDIDDVLTIVKVEAEAMAQQWFRDFPVRHADGTLMVPSPKSPNYVARSQGLVHYRLRLGELVATGFDFRDPTKRVKIAADSWNALKLIVESSEARTDAFAYLGIRVSRPNQPTLQASAPIGEGTIKKFIESLFPEGKNDGPS